MECESFVLLVPVAFLALMVVAESIESCYVLDRKITDRNDEKVKSPFCNTSDGQVVLAWFLRYFDEVFIVPDLFRPRYWRCTWFSILALGLVISLWFFMSVIFSLESCDILVTRLFFNENAWLMPTTPLFGTWMIVSFVCPTIFFGSYLSSWETRYVISRIVASTTLLGRLILWFVDVLLNVLIFVCTMILGNVVFYIGIVIHYSSWSDVTLIEGVAKMGDAVLDAFLSMIGLFLNYSMLHNFLLFHEDEYYIIGGICFYVLMSTTLWAGGSVLVGKLWRFVGPLSRILRTQEFPLGASTAGVIILLAAMVLLANGSAIVFA